ncbi:hypothetical protein SYNPS1DRAFT_29151 [Syncephalis pseudoplumigaleata]|uniref:G-patch domain-containing protein n=1 Tax=Syncephalis pseudoplumigaleata TaxID=1712513 RepID=A0A4P9Z087_9FUNG|nr:hypothetical protein SYNPS1DRAFT_29151 [Syncephalis pseudoplumigaleata]|eukprot:RKP25101.1 hypothetical protein SYNPS1DRAFT_29151 [Syncephalis pseudoplumigaleata]
MYRRGIEFVAEGTAAERAEATRSRTVESSESTTAVVDFYRNLVLPTESTSSTHAVRTVAATVSADEVADTSGDVLWCPAGWEDDQGLGAELQGRRHPIAARMRPKQLGLGAKERPTSRGPAMEVGGYSIADWLAC